MDDNDKRYCDSKHEAEQQLCAEKEHKLQARLDGMDRALILHANDMERRLEGLNQLRQDVVEDRKDFLPQRVYDIKTSAYDIWCTEVNRRITVIETRSITWTAAIGTFVIAVQVALRFWK